MKNFASDIVPWIIIGGLLLLFFFLTLLNRKIKQLASANRELDNVKELWRTFYDADTGYVYLKDKDLKYMFINRALANFFRRPYSEIIGRSDFSLLEKGFAQISTKSDQEALKQNRLLITVDSWNGRHFRTTKFPVPLPDGSMGVGAYIWDITEEYVLQRIQERMIKRNRLLLAVLSRKFRNTKEQLDYALKELLEMSGSKYGYIYSYDEEKKEFHFNCWRQIGPGEEGGRDLPETYKLEETGVWGEMTIQRKPFIMNRLKGPGPLDGKGREAASRFESFMSVPVIIADKLGLLNTTSAIILPGIFSAFGVFMLRQFLMHIPNSYIEAAKIDGASHLRIFYQIIIPLVQPGIAALVVLLFVDNWNMVEQPLIFLEDAFKQPLSLYLSHVNEEARGIAFAASVLYMTPMVVLYLYSESYFVQGIQLSGVKG